MRREINMYNPTSPAAFWVMECQEWFGAVLIMETLKHPHIHIMVCVCVLAGWRSVCL